MTNLKDYPRVILLFGDGVYTEYTPGRLVTTREVNEAELIIAWDHNGNSTILKDRWGAF